MKISLITGSGRGIGAATAVMLAKQSKPGEAGIVINDLDEANAKKVAQEIEALGQKTMTSCHDVSDYKQAQALIEAVRTKFGRLDILVNNAGITRDAMLSKMTEEQWDSVIKVNLKGPFNVVQAGSKLMAENKWGRIVNLASVAWLGNIGQTNYAASKAGVVGMTRTWALELARHGITVNAIAPGFIDTAMTQAVPEEVKAKFVSRIPLKRMGAVDDIASIIAFLSSEAAGYVTGQTIQVDGGLSTGISVS